MATYTITINERITANKRLLDLLKSMPGVTLSTTGRAATLSAIEELDNGGGTRCKSMDELKRKLMK
ncbi:MAG: hypothetical protein J6B65_06310 [Paludibacteraceae bacterium]|nr:hypothetical protein [Paludibacteraceae bacterium]